MTDSKPRKFSGDYDENLMCSLAHRKHGTGEKNGAYKDGFIDGCSAKYLELKNSYDAAIKQIEELKAKLVHRHIIGKAYEVSADSINKLAGELDEVKQELQETKIQAQRLAEAIKEAKDMYWHRSYDGSGTIKAVSVNEFDRRMDEALKLWQAFINREGEA